MGYLGRKPETLAGVVELSSNVASSIVNANVGILSNLQTTVKTNVVAAINEVRGGGFSNVQITGGSISNTVISSTTVNGTLAGAGTFANVFPSNVPATSAQILTGNVVFQGTGGGVTFTKGTSTYAKYIGSVTNMANLNFLESDTWYINTLVNDSVINFFNVPTGNVPGSANTVISTGTIIYPASGTAYKANIWVNGAPATQNNFLYGTIPQPRSSAVNVYSFTILFVNGESRVLGSHSYYDTF